MITYLSAFAVAITLVFVPATPDRQTRDDAAPSSTNAKLSLPIVASITPKQIEVLGSNSGTGLYVLSDKERAVMRKALFRSAKIIG
jgi:hypothetical protein